MGILGRKERILVKRGTWEERKNEGGLWGGVEVKGGEKGILGQKEKGS